MTLLALIALICVSMAAGVDCCAGSTRWAYAKGHRGGLDSGLIRGEARGYRRGIKHAQHGARHAQPESDAAWGDAKVVLDPPHDPDATAVLPRLADATTRLPRIDGQRAADRHIPRQRGWGR
jgi:hypothetical protein